MKTMKYVPLNPLEFGMIEGLHVQLQSSTVNVLMVNYPYLGMFADNYHLSASQRSWICC